MDNLEKIHEKWLEPLEYPQHIEELLIAREEKKTILKSVNVLIESLPIDEIQTFNELDDTVLSLEKILLRLKEQRNELLTINVQFPDEVLELERF